MNRHSTPLLAALLGILVNAPLPARAESFQNFESGHVRPLALTPDGSRLFAVNTPDNRLAIYDVSPTGLTLAGEVPVGLEPVAVAVRTPSEVWVVNHLSDSVSVVAVDSADPSRSRLVRTLLVGDEPRDIVFAAGGRAFVTAAHRGQNRPGDPELRTEGVGRADVWVFDPSNLGGALGGAPLTILQLFGDTARALAVSPDGGTVYAAVFQSGNQTTAIHLLSAATSGGSLPGPPGATPGAPGTGVIVKRNPATGAWEDESGRDRSSKVAFNLPDLDVFAIDATANPPVAIGAVAGVGTTLFNMAVRPDNGRVYVTNLEARNILRFEPVLRGHVVENRISVIAGTVATPVHLNAHVDYGAAQGPPGEVAQSLALPTDLVFGGGGHTVYVAAMGSDAVGVLDADALETGVVSRSLIPVGRGPSGLALDEAGGRIYVMNRVDHTISVVSTAMAGEMTRVALRYDPSPPAVRVGRRELYNARRNSAHGDMACASCHLFGDLDGLAWDLGDPFGPILPNPNPMFSGTPLPLEFHPMKGPMTTRSLRGLPGTGPLHWRGDRTGGNDPGGGNPLDVRAAFRQFNATFVALLGRSEPLPATTMEELTDFVLTLQHPPNPVRALDGVPTTVEAHGANLFGFFCASCHVAPLGTAGFTSFDFEPQHFKIPELRNMYQKVGRFGATVGTNPVPHLGDQVRGFGFLHDGTISTLEFFSEPPLFNIPDPADRAAIDAFQLSFDTGLRPIVGQQVTLTAANSGSTDVLGRLDLLVARAHAGDCELVVHGLLDGVARGWLSSGGVFRSDRASEPLLDLATLLEQASATEQERTFSCVPPGSGTRIGLDRDEDGAFDRDELDAGTDPAGGPPGVDTTVLVRTTRLHMRDNSVPGIQPTRGSLRFEASTAADPPANQIVPPARGEPGDPTRSGAVLSVFNASGERDEVGSIALAGTWKPLGSSRHPRGYRYRGAGDDPVRSIVLTPNRLIIQTRNVIPPFSLNEGSQRRLGVQLVLSGGPSWCSDAPPRLAGRPPRVAPIDRPGEFVAQRDSAPPVACMKPVP